MIAITRPVSPSIINCELTYLEREPIDLERAERQHREYERYLKELGTAVVQVPPAPELPDAVFVEDAAIVLDEIAVITRPGVESRRAETSAVAEVVGRYRPRLYIEPPATLDGGDVLRVDRVLYVGHSTRTNVDGINQLRARVAPFGYEVRSVAVGRCLHLKSACSYIGDETLLVNRQWLDAGVFGGLRLVDVPPTEPRAVGTITVGRTILMPSGYPETTARLHDLGHQVRSVDISEFRKAEAGVSCLSILVDGEQEEGEK